MPPKEALRLGRRGAQELEVRELETRADCTADERVLASCPRCQPQSCADDVRRRRVRPVTRQPVDDDAVEVRAGLVELERIAFEGVPRFV
jgi:hypothetical protein